MTPGRTADAVRPSQLRQDLIDLESFTNETTALVKNFM